MEEVIKMTVEFKITYKTKADRKEAIIAAKNIVLGDETQSSTISVKPIKASETK